MNEEQADRILEAGLEEVLGGHYPPDLTAKILQTWEARQQSPAQAARAADNGTLRLAAAALPLAPPLHPLAEPAPPPRHGGAPVQGDRGRDDRTELRRRWVTLAVAASLLLVTGVTAWYAARQSGGPSSRPLARSEQVTPVAGGEPSLPPLPEFPGLPSVPGVQPEQAQPASRPPAAHAPTAPPGPTASPDSLPPTVVAAAPPAVRPAHRKSVDAEVIAFINDAVRQGWRERSVTPSPAAPDEEWCARVYQRLVGRDPTSDELNQFLRQRDKEQTHRRTLVDRLLASDEYARYWSELWTTALVGPASGGSPPSEFNRDALAGYLTKAVREDRPHAQVASELLTATGAADVGVEGHNAAVHFLLAGAKSNAAAATDRTARVFLGKQLVCTSCHANREGGLELGDFWELNAFFQQMKVERDPASQRVALTDRDFAGASGAAKDAELFYRLPDGRLGMAYPEFQDQAISHSGLLSDVHRRRELAKLVVASDDFHRATVNRVWSWLLGYGFSQPVDDLGPHNPPSHPELLDRLAAELAAHDSHTKGLVRWIVLSEPFGLSSKRMPESWLDTPESGATPLFARYYAKEKRAGDVAQLLVQAVHRRPVVAYAVSGALARRAWLRPSLHPPQIIEVHPDAQWSGPAWLPSLGRSKLPPEKKIEHVFLSVLARKPSAREMTAAKLVLADRPGEPAAIQEVWRTLLASLSATGRSAAQD